MTGIALDTNIVVGMMSPSDSLHEAASAAVRSTETVDSTFIISAVTWSETLTGILRYRRMSESEFSDLVDSFADEVVPVGREIGSRAAHLRSTHSGLRTPDALIIATAQERGAEILLSGDKKLKNVAPELVELVAP